MAGRIYSSLLIAIASSLLLGITAHAQIIGPGPKQGKLQIGGWIALMNYDQVHRYVEQSENWYLQRDVSRDRAGISIRYGITNSTYALVNLGYIQRLKYGLDYITGVFGVGGGVRLLSTHDVNVRAGGHYNDVFQFDRDRASYPWRGRDARVAISGDKNLRVGAVRCVPSVGVVYFWTREKEYESWSGSLRREKNRHYLSPLVGGIVTLADRVSFGLELTFGAITDFRWRTEIQL